MTPRSKNLARRGFTLVEMLVILGVIILILAIALPAFNTITGSRSVEAGTNIASASIGRARAEAIRRGVSVGVLFYPDAEGRTNVAFVALGDGSSDPDPYDEYKAYVDAGDYQGATTDPLPDYDGEPVMTSDRALALGVDNNNSDYGPATAYDAYTGRPLVLVYNARSFDPDALTTPGIVGQTPVVAGDTSNRPAFQNDHWDLAGGTRELILLTDIPIEQLPSGVGLQLVTGAALDADSGSAGAVDANNSFLERYTRTGMIAFDRKGRMIQANYEISGNSPLGQRMGLNLIAENNPGQSVDVGGGNPANDDIGFTFGSSGFGIVIYRTDEFESAASDGTATDWKGSFFLSIEDPPTIIDDFETTEHDLNAPYPNFDPTFLPPATLLANEYAEERWLDANTTPLLINRFSGTLAGNAGDQADN